jgi:hypothetical protein
MPASVDWIIVGAPIIGGISNLSGQVLMGRLARSWSLARVIVAAFIWGLGVTAGMVLVAWTMMPPALLNAIGLGLSVFIVYCCGSITLFTLVNLAETSLRVNMLRRLMASSDGLSEADLLSGASDTSLVRVRVVRMRQRGLVRVSRDRLFPRFSLLLMIAAGLSLIKRLLYGSA